VSEVLLYRYGAGADVEVLVLRRKSVKVHQANPRDRERDREERHCEALGGLARRPVQPEATFAAPAADELTDADKSGLLPLMITLDLAALIGVPRGPAPPR